MPAIYHFGTKIETINLIELNTFSYRTISTDLPWNTVCRLDACFVVVAHKERGSKCQQVVERCLVRDSIGCCQATFGNVTRARPPALFLRTQTDFAGQAASLERWAALLPFTCKLLAIPTPDFIIGYHLFVPVTFVDTAFL